MNILVTGATGFIGAAVARKLVQRGEQVTLLVRNPHKLYAVEDILSSVEIRYGDVTDLPSLITATKGITHIYHCAGKAYIGPKREAELYAINVQGTKNLLQAAAYNDVQRIVYTSSVSAIGITGTKQPADESQRWNLDTLNVPYYTSKHLAEEAVREAAQKGQDCVIVNPSYVFGAGDINFHAGQLIRDLYYHKVPVYPTGGVCVADVEDVAEGHLAAMEKGQRGERYILGGENLTYKQIFDIICRVVGAPKVLVPLSESIVKIFVALTEKARRLRRITALANREILISATKFFYFTSQKAISELGFSNARSVGDAFVETIARAFSWYRAHRLI
ncbi:MAG: SDR family oxidoreductase [Chloroherpetonaceae bacterium]|nr:SDR family oxidoreductase [Chloroherpetonaceae bacterium]